MTAQPTPAGQQQRGPLARAPPPGLRTARGGRTRPPPRRPPRAGGRRRSASSGGRVIRPAISSSSGRTRFAATVGAHGPSACRRSIRETWIAGDAVARCVRLRRLHGRRLPVARPAPATSRAVRRRSPARRSHSPSLRRARRPARVLAAAPGTAAWCGGRPVPKACAGSITRSIPSPASGGSHGGRTRNRRRRQLTSTGRVERPSTAPPSRPGPPRSRRRPARRPRPRARSGSAGSSPGAP